MLQAWGVGIYNSASIIAGKKWKGIGIHKREAVYSLGVHCSSEKKQGPLGKA